MQKRILEFKFMFYRSLNSLYRVTSIHSKSIYERVSLCDLAYCSRIS